MQQQVDRRGSSGTAAHSGRFLRLRCTAVAVSPPPRAPAAWRGDPPAASSLPLLPSGRPDYRSIDSQPQSRVLTAVIRKLLVDEVGSDADTRPWTDFDGLLTSVRAVNDRPGSAGDVQAAARRVFQGILPQLWLGWVPPAWRAAVQPVVPPWLANASFFLVFATLFPWLMGPLSGEEHVEVAAPVWTHYFLRVARRPLVLRVPQAVKAERCRFLEATQCASVCVNSCKAPTQAWLGDDFGMDVHIQPNYSDLSCVWSFGKKPPPLAEDEALLVPCFKACPSTERGAKDAARQIERLRRGMGVAAGRDIYTGEKLEDIAARAGRAAIRDAAWGEPEQRAAAVAAAGKCWSVSDDRATLGKA